jgi:hypothetical protein
MKCPESLDGGIRFAHLIEARDKKAHVVFLYRAPEITA